MLKDVFFRTKFIWEALGVSVLSLAEDLETNH